MRLKDVKRTDSVKLHINRTVRDASVLVQILSDIVSFAVDDLKLEQADDIFIVG